MNTYTVGDRPRLTYAFTQGNPLVPADPAKVVFVINPGVMYTWLQAGGGDAQVVRDSIGVFHVDWPIAAFGVHSYSWQAYDSFGITLEASEGQFFAN